MDTNLFFRRSTILTFFKENSAALKFIHGKKWKAEFEKAEISTDPTPVHYIFQSCYIYITNLQCKK